MCLFMCYSATLLWLLFSLMLSSYFFSNICLTACLSSCNLLALPLFVCSSVFQLNNRASFFRDLVFRVTPQRGNRGNGWTHQTHSPSLLSYLAGGRWWYPFPPSNVFALHPMPSVNMQLLDSHFSFEVRGQVEWTETLGCFFFIFPSFFFSLLLFFKVENW